MPDDHSKLVPPLPIPNRTVKRLRADDSAATSVKVGYRQATILKTPDQDLAGGFSFVRQPNSRADWRSVNERIRVAESAKRSFGQEAFR